MKRKLINIIIYIVFIVIVIAAFKVPSLIFEYQDKNKEIGISTRENKEIDTKIDVEDTYIIQMIHDIRGQDVMVYLKNISISKAKTTTNEEGTILSDIDKELKKLKENNVINGPIAYKQDIEIVERTYRKEDSKSYIVNSVFLEGDTCTYKMEIEKETGKVIRISTKDTIFENTTKEELMRNYLKYLGLEKIDEWKYDAEYDMLTSVKTNLVVTLIEGEDEYILSLV